MYKTVAGDYVSIANGYEEYSTKMDEFYFRVLGFLFGGEASYTSITLVFGLFFLPWLLSETVNHFTTMIISL